VTDTDLPDVEAPAPSIARLARRALRPGAPAAAVPVDADSAEVAPADVVPADVAPADVVPAEVSVAEPVAVDDLVPAAEGDEVAESAPVVVARPEPSRLVTVALAGLVALALVFAAISGTVWWRDGHGGSSTEARARDAVLLQVHLDLATLNTLDYRAVDAGLARWSAVTTGSLHQGIASASASTKAAITSAKMVTKAVVLDAAVTSLDLHKGSANVIASIQVTKTPDTGSPVVDRNRVSATMTLVHGIWRVSDLQGVLVQLS
jgi:Mce-associated membrane protein